MRTTKAMREIESREQKPIKELLLELFDEHGRQAKVASQLGINQGTLSDWLFKLGFEQKTVLVERIANEDVEAQILVSETGADRK